MFLQTITGLVFRSIAHIDEQKITISTDLPKAEREMIAMAIHHASPGEVFDLLSLGSNLKDARTTAIVKSESFEVVRLIVHADVDIKTHQVDGPIMLHCLEGKALLGLHDKTLELSGGQWVYFEGGVPHSIRGIQDTSLLLTILFPFGNSGRPHAKPGQP